MSLSSIDLWQKIAAEGIASTLLCRSWASEVAEVLPAEHAQDGIRVLKQLIKSGRLTEYQAKILAGRSQKPLRHGQWHILHPVEASLWPGWLEVAKIDNGNANRLTPQWCTWLDSETVDALEPSLPSLPRAIRLAGLQEPSLQKIEIPVLADGQLQLQVQPVAGRSLTSCVSSDPLDAAQIELLVRQVASALAALHEQGIEHGRVMPDRIFWDGNKATLILDPIAAHTAILDKRASGVLAEELGPLKTAHCLAPEFVAPGQTATMASDVFALGCVWWWLLTGEPAADGVDTQSILSSQADPLPSLPPQVALQEPYQRVLMHCLARNAAARFRSATQLCQAIEAAQTVIQNGKQPAPQTQPTALPHTALPTTTAKESPTGPKPAEERPQSQVTKSGIAKPESAKSSPKPQKSETKAEKAQPKKEGTKPKTTAEPERKKTDAITNQSKEQATIATSAPTDASRPASAETPRNAPAATASRPDIAPAKAAIGTPTKQPSASAIPTTTSTQATTSSQAIAKVRKRRKRGNNKWMLPVFGGGGFLIIMLLALKLSGALDWSATKEEVAERPAYVPPSTNAPEVIDRDPRLDRFRIVESSGAELWAPPSIGTPFPRDLLPPGGQCFVTFSPSNWMSATENRDLIATFAEQVNPLLQLLSDRAGVQLEDIDLLTVALFDAPNDGAFPQWSARVRLNTPTSLADLKKQWKAGEEVQIGGVSLLTASPAAGDEPWAYFIPTQPLLDTQAVEQFSCGPLNLMRETAEMEGAAGPLISQMESLWEASNSDLDASILFSPPYLFSEGRGILQTLPERLQSQLRELLGKDARAALLQTDLASQWYYEAQVVGAAPRDAGTILAALENKVTGLAAAIESWFVDETPDPYWRALALRYPQMLRTAADNSRFGVENGVAITNTYLPPESASNLLLASYIALQETATLAAGVGSPPASTDTKPLSIEQYLGRSIRLSFAQEPIEVALKLAGEEANEKLPAGTRPLRFELDGDAFELAGITRNFQLRDFEMNDKPIRDVLTEIARRGNPVPNITDLKLDDQKLIWVVRDDPSVPGSQMISLTTRDSATKAQIPLPIEFAP